MGYDFAVGKFGKIKSEWGDYRGIIKSPELDCGVEGLLFNDNHWSMTYTNFGRFVDATNTKELFDRLMPDHPAKVKITIADIAAFDEAIEAFKERFPNAVPSFRSDHNPDMPLMMTINQNGAEFSWNKDHLIDQNAWLGTLVRFRFWFQWAIDNCKNPTFKNS